MGQKLQDGKKVLQMSQLTPHSKSHPLAKTIHMLQTATIFKGWKVSLLFCQGANFIVFQWSLNI